MSNNNEFSPAKLGLIAIAVFGMGYVVGNSDDEELRGDIDSILESFKNNKDKAKKFLVNIIESSENIDSDELRFNLEKLISYAKDKIDEMDK